jgi:SAM-dependent methyltransferase
LKSQAVTHRQCTDPIYQRWCGVLRERPRLHRKLWEYVYVLRALEQSGCLGAGRRGLGFGVGREPLVAALAASGCRILATDLAPDDPAVALWAASGEYGGHKAALNERGICPPEQFDERVSFAHADMRRATAVGGRFDFVWSSCACEHLGSLDAGLDFIRASLDLLEPGGVAVHTTEYNVSSNGRTVEAGPVVLFRRRDLRALAQELRAAGHGIELNFQTGSDPEDRLVDLPPFDGACHLKLLHTHFGTTSFGLLIRKVP